MVVGGKKIWIVEWNGRRDWKLEESKEDKLRNDSTNKPCWSGYFSKAPKCNKTLELLTVNNCKTVYLSRTSQSFISTSTGYFSVPLIKQLISPLRNILLFKLLTKRERQINQSHLIRIAPLLYQWRSEKIKILPRASLRRLQPKNTQKYVFATRDLRSVELVLAQCGNINAIAITIYHFLMGSFQTVWQSYHFYGCCRSMLKW